MNAMAKAQGKATGIPAVIKAEHDTTLPGSEWKQFFEDAEIPPEDIPRYGKMFAENRITIKRLVQLTEDHLEKMGIKVLGDRVGIMDQAKKVCAEMSSRQDASASAGGTIREEASNQRGRGAPEISQEGRRRRDGRDDISSSSSSERTNSRGNTVVRGNVSGERAVVAGNISGGVHHGSHITDNRGSKHVNISGTTGGVVNAPDGNVNYR